MVELDNVRYPMLEEDNLRLLLAERAPWFTGSIDDITWRLVVRFERRLVEGFGKSRVWLAGDAGHMTSPVGVQSMNIGLREAHELATLVADDLAGTPGMGARLNEYGQQRLAEWRRLFGIEGGLAPSDAAPEWVRSHASQLVLALPGSGAGLDSCVSSSYKASRRSASSPALARVIRAARRGPNGPFRKRFATTEE